MTAVIALPEYHLQFAGKHSFEPPESIYVGKKDYKTPSDAPYCAAVADATRNAVAAMADRLALASRVSLTDIATSDNDPGVRRAAVRKLTDQAVLAGIVLNDKEMEVCRAAARRLPASEMPPMPSSPLPRRRPTCPSTFPRATCWWCCCRRRAT